jgi:hypothetical protein
MKKKKDGRLSRESAGGCYFSGNGLRLFGISGEAYGDRTFCGKEMV